MTIPDDLRPLVPSALAECDLALAPAAKTDFRNELTTCLMLVAAVGMTDEARAGWLKVAWATLRDLPADLLAIGATEARKSADHPSKIVPIIVKATKDLMAARTAERAKVARLLVKRTPMPWDDDYEPTVRCSPEDAAAIIDSHGLRAEPKREFMRHVGEPAAPTRFDYIAMGVAPEIVDRLLRGHELDGDE